MTAEHETTSIQNLSVKSSFTDELPADFFTYQDPTLIPDPYLIYVSAQAAQLIQFNPDEFRFSAFVNLFSGNTVFQQVRPWSAVYSGHQFGVWAGQLGDGRVISIGSASTLNGPWELQLKGAGSTPYSRMGDGRAVLRSSVRELLCSEAMYGLNIPTARALCLVGSHLPVYRENIETAAIVTRMAPSFIRFGSFEHWAAQGRTDYLKILADYVIRNFYPELQDAAHPYSDLLKIVTQRTAALMAHWQSVGFMHGVMNTDNMSILGLTLDYGPFGFMEAFNPSRICNHSDTQGRYAYNRQPDVGQWNCYALGQALQPLINDRTLIQDALAEYSITYQYHYQMLFRKKIGLHTEQQEDTLLLSSLFKIMEHSEVDFTLFFRTLGCLNIQNTHLDQPIRDLFIYPQDFDLWAEQYRARLKKENSINSERQAFMNAINPKYILRNHLAHTAIEQAKQNDFSEITRLSKILEHPFDEQPKNAHYADLPPDWAKYLEVSCSS